MQPQLDSSDSPWHKLTSNSPKIHTLIKLGVLTLTIILLLSSEIAIARADSSGVADWPTEAFDNRRSRYNPLERDLVPAAVGAPSSFVVQPWLEGSSIVVGEQLFWLKRTTIGGNTDLPLVRSTDLEGSERWEYSFGTDGFINTAFSPSVVRDLFIFGFFETEFLESTEYLIVLNRETGEFVWRHPIGLPSHGGKETYVPYATTDDTIFIGWEEENIGYVGSFDLDSGAERWKTQVDSVGSRNTDFFAIANDAVVAIHFTHMAGYDIATGQELWQVDLAARSNWIGAPNDLLVVGNIAIYAGITDVQAIDVTDGSFLWQFFHEEDNGCSEDVQLATDNELLIVAGICGDAIVALDVTTGVEAWRKEVPLSLNVSINALAIANGTLYAAGIGDSFQSQVWGLDLATGDGTPLISGFGSAEQVRGLAVASGKLVVPVAQYTSREPKHTTYFYGDTGTLDDGYLDFFDNDSYPATNPVASDTQPMVKRDSSYGTEISIGARIGLSPATLKVYNADGSIYKEADDTPDKFGNGYWLAPLEYTPDGYEYQVILADGTELVRRTVTMPAAPEENLEEIQLLNGLTWVNPPATVTDASTTLVAALPAEMEAVNAQAVLLLQSQERGAITIPGRVAGNNVEFPLDDDHALNGTFVATAKAQSGNVTAFSPDINITIDSPDLPDVRIQNQTSFIPQSGGGAERISYSFERTRPTVDPTVQADAQFADISVDPAGLQATLYVETPAFDINDPRTAKWAVGVVGYDEQGNEIARSVEEIPATDGKYVVMSLDQNGLKPIVRLEAIASTLEGSEAVAAAWFTPTQLNCTPDNNSSSSPNNKKKFEITDIVAVNLDVGVAAEAIAGLGSSGALYVQKNFVNGQVQACAEAGVRAGGGASVGPMGALGLTLDLRGPNHAAPVSSGTKLDVSVAAGLGLQVSYSIPDNFGDSGYGQLGLAVTGAPDANFSGGITEYVCVPKKEEPKCCKGSSCPPDPDSPPGPPGNDHPDDTHSVVINRNAPDESSAKYWRSVAVFARQYRHNELADYAAYRMRDAEYLDELARFPIGSPLTEDQLDTLSLFRQNRIQKTLELQGKWATIQAQLDLMTRRQVNVLANGYYTQMSTMLASMGLPNQLVSTDFSPAALADGALVIPTAGLYGLGGDTTFAARLDKFVQDGGTLVVMTQPEDAGLDLLPNAWTQVGYQNDISCYAAAMTPIASHPLIASVGTDLVTSHVDGYMTSIPPSAQLLMERTKNGQGAFALDQYGEGYMIVTNMYDDWGRGVGQTTPQIRALFRDVMRWAAAPDKNLAEGHPGESVTVPVIIENTTETDSAKVRYLLKDSGGVLEREWIVSRSIIAGGTANESVAVTSLPATLGIWGLTYELLDADDAVVQSEAWGSFVAITEPNAGNFNLAQVAAESSLPALNTDVDVALVLDKPAYAPDSPIAATLNISLTNPTAGAELRILLSLGETSQEKTVAAAANVAVTFNLPADFSNDGLLFYGIYDSATDQSLHLDTNWIQPAGSVTILPEQTRYAAGETVTLNISGNYQGSVSIDGPDFSQTLTVAAGETTKTVTLPAVMSSATYAVRYQSEGALQSSHFDVVGPRVTISNMDVANHLVNVGETIRMTATVQADTKLTTTLFSQLIDSDGIAFSAVQKDVTLSAGEQAIPLDVPIQATVSGNVRFELYVVDKQASGIVYAQAHRFAALDALQLLSLRTESDAVPLGDGEVLLDLYSPSAADVELAFEMDGTPLMTQPISVEPGFSTHSIPLPNEVTMGEHNLYVSTQNNNIESTAQTLLVVGSAAEIKLFLPLVQ